MQGLRPPRLPGAHGPIDRSAVPPLYMQLFNASSVALKAVSTRLRVGGPATMQLFDVESFLEQCAAQAIAGEPPPTSAAQAPPLPVAAAAFAPHSCSSYPPCPS